MNHRYCLPIVSEILPPHRAEREKPMTVPTPPHRDLVGASVPARPSHTGKHGPGKTARANQS